MSEYKPIEISELSDPDTSAMISWDFGKGTESFDLLNMGDKTSLGNIPKLTDVLGWIKVFLGWVVSFIYVYAMKNQGMKILEDMPKYQTSSTVTNYSVLGNSVGALVAKGVQVALIIGFITIIGQNLLVVNNETTLMGDTSTGFSTLDALFQSLASGYGFMSESLKWLLLIIPMGTIFSFSRILLIQILCIYVLINSLTYAPRVAS